MEMSIGGKGEPAQHSGIIVKLSLSWTQITLLNRTVGQHPSDKKRRQTFPPFITVIFVKPRLYSEKDEFLNNTQQLE